MHFFFIFLAFLLASCASSPYSHLPLEEWGRAADCCQKKGKKWAIASGGTFSSQAGEQMFKKGGNLVDAAVATAFSLAVERPHSLGLGGGGFGVLYLNKKKPEVSFVDFRETAPEKAHRDMFLDKNGSVIPNLSRLGALSVATPGFVNGLYQIHKKWGVLNWKTVMQPAIDLAEKGFPVYLSLAKAIEKESAELLKQDSAKALLLKDGKPLSKGDRFVQSDLNKTLIRISRNPENELRTGFTAKKISEFIKQAGGILTISDLMNYKPRFERPLTYRWKNRTLYMARLPSAGGILFSEMLEMLSQDNLSNLKEEDYFHLVTEVLKRAYADRSTVVGDFSEEERFFSKILSKGRIIDLRRSVDMGRATPAEEIQPFSEAALKDQHTTHLSIIDEKGNAVSITLTINEHFGSRLLVPETGIFLNNEMDDFSSKPGSKNTFGLLGSKANAIAPGKRPASSMSPTIVADSQGPLLAIGGAGGSRITSQVFQVMMNVLERTKGNLREALFAPRLHHQWNPDTLEVENGMAAAVMSSLKDKGHHIQAPKYSAIIQAVYRDAQNELEAVFDPRDEGGVEAQ